MELGALEGVICGLVLGAMGIMTAFLVPIAEQLLELQQSGSASPHIRQQPSHKNQTQKSILPHEHIREMHIFK